MPDPRRRDVVGEVPPWQCSVRLRRCPWNGDDGVEVLRDVTAADTSVTPPSPGIRARWGCHRRALRGLLGNAPDASLKESRAPWA